jgi:PPM family protein phosphatase
MNQQDWLVLISLLVIAVIGGYYLGRQPRPVKAKRAIAKDDAKAPVAKQAPAPAPAKKAAPVAAPVVAAAPSPAPAPAPPPAPAPAPVVAASPDIEIVRIEYEEDEDIDPTKIGGAAAPKRAVYQPPVQRIFYDEDAAEDEPTRSEALFLISAMAQTDPGLRRKRNEDSVLVVESAGLFVVADGMGGYKGGELASKLAVKTISEAFENSSFEGDPHEKVPRRASELARSIQMANAAILETAKQQPDLEGMGTTICAARFSANKKRLYVGHVGDSRCYRFRDGVFKQMTADHTMADRGVTGPEAAHLSRAVGIWPTVPIDILLAVPLEGDVYLLCSDGLTKMLKDPIIEGVLREEEDLKTALEKLIVLANARGGKDNITVILVRVVPPNWKPKPSSPPPPGGAA